MKESIEYILAGSAKEKDVRAVFSKYGITALGQPVGKETVYSDPRFMCRCSDVLGYVKRKKMKNGCDSIWQDELNRLQKIKALIGGSSYGAKLAKYNKQRGALIKKINTERDAKAKINMTGVGVSKSLDYLRTASYQDDPKYDDFIIKNDLIHMSQMYTLKKTDSNIDKSAEIFGHDSSYLSVNTQMTIGKNINTAIAELSASHKGVTYARFEQFKSLLKDLLKISKTVKVVLKTVPSAPVTEKKIKIAKLTFEDIVLADFGETLFLTAK